MRSRNALNWADESACVVAIVNAQPDLAAVTDVTRLSLDRARDIGARQDGLAVAATTRSDGSIQSSVVNAGVLEHPVTGEPIVAFVARGAVKKLANLRLRPRVTIVFRAGWDWVTVEGVAELVGPDDHIAGFEPADLPRLLRSVYSAAVGGVQDDWAALDAAMSAERHTAVLVRPDRVYSNPVV